MPSSSTSARMWFCVGPTNSAPRSTTSAAGDRPAQHPPADALARLEHRDRVPGARDLARRDEPRQPGPDDDDVLAPARAAARPAARWPRPRPPGSPPRRRCRRPPAAPATSCLLLIAPLAHTGTLTQFTRCTVKRAREIVRRVETARPPSPARLTRRWQSPLPTPLEQPTFPSRRSPSEWLAAMTLIRRFEERAGEMYAKAKVGGFLHLAIGEEATIVGSTRALRDQDYLISTYRSHGHTLARGSDPNRVMAELFGRVDGLCKGRGGSMHMFDLEKRFMGGYGIVGGNLPIAAGFALASDYNGLDEATLCQFGDGASNQGTFGETMNLAALWSLPVVFMITNNRFGMGTALERHSAMTDLLRKGEGFGVPGMRCDGMDVLDTYNVTTEALQDGPRGAQAGARRGADVPLPRALDGRPRGVPHEGAGRRVAQEGPARRLRRPARRGRHHERRRARAARRRHDQAHRRGRRVRRRLAAPVAQRRSTTTSTCSATRSAAGTPSTSAPRPRTAARTSAG